MDALEGFRACSCVEWLNEQSLEDHLKGGRGARLYRYRYTSDSVRLGLSNFNIVLVRSKVLEDCGFCTIGNFAGGPTYAIIIPWEFSSRG